MHRQVAVLAQVFPSIGVERKLFSFDALDGIATFPEGSNPVRFHGRSKLVMLCVSFDPLIMDKGGRYV